MRPFLATLAPPSGCFFFYLRSGKGRRSLTASGSHLLHCTSGRLNWRKGLCSQNVCELGISPFLNPLAPPVSWRPRSNLALQSSSLGSGDKYGNVGAYGYPNVWFVLWPGKLGGDLSAKVHTKRLTSMYQDLAAYGSSYEFLTNQTPWLVRLNVVTALQKIILWYGL